MIRDYCGRDLEGIVRLDDVCFQTVFRFSRESMRLYAEAKNAIALVAEDEGGETAGFVILHMEETRGGRRGYVVTLDVAPQWRRVGLAGRLMDEGEARVVSAGGEWMELHVFAGNEGAIRFYERRGYERVGLRRGFYGAGLDAIVYQKDLRTDLQKNPG